ncbi:hypothetical protein MASR1M8_10530 [Thermomonas brevis]
MRLKDAPAVPMPRWAISWGHPVHERLRAFAARLDAGILRLLGDLEAPGPFLGSVENYNRLAMLPADVRERRQQALVDFPPLVVPLLLRTNGWPSLLPDQYDEDRARDVRQQPCPPDVLQAIDRGRDLIGALAAHYRVGRALVQSAPMRSPWASLTEVRGVLRMLELVPAHARPRTLASLETWWPAAKALPTPAGDPASAAALGRVFAKGWDATWESTGLSPQDAPPRLRDCRDFLAAATREIAETHPMRGIDAETLGMAWLARRGLRSLLDASVRWHAQAMVPNASPTDACEATALSAIVGECADEGHHAVELLTASALVAEGQAMAHCVGDYWDRCERSGDRIFRLALADGEQATAHFVLGGMDVDGPRYELGDVRGSANAASSPGMWYWAERVAREINGPAREDARRRASIDAGTCARRAMASRPGWVRPFDRISRRELDLVVAWLYKHLSVEPKGDVLVEDEVAGIGYANALDCLDEIVVGDPLELVREPANPHDPNAIRIEWSGRKLGYVPRRSNAGLARLLDRCAMLDARLTRVERAGQGWPVVEFRVRSACVDAALPVASGGLLHPAGRVP